MMPINLTTCANFASFSIKGLRSGIKNRRNNSNTLYFINELQHDKLSTFSILLRVLPFYKNR